MRTLFRGMPDKVKSHRLVQILTMADHLPGGSEPGGGTSDNCVPEPQHHPGRQQQPQPQRRGSGDAVHNGAAVDANLAGAQRVDTINDSDWRGPSTGPLGYWYPPNAELCPPPQLFRIDTRHNSAPALSQEDHLSYCHLHLSLTMAGDHLKSNYTAAVAALLRLSAETANGARAA